MEFLKISLIMFIFFYFSIFNFLKILLFKELFYYYKNNKNILLEKLDYCNILFYYLITLYEISYNYILIGYKKIKNNYIRKYIHSYLEIINTKYLELKNYLINKLFNIIIQIGIMIMFKNNKFNKNNKNNKSNKSNKSNKNNKSNKKFNFNKFLDDLDK
jgi:hypothetical protein